MKRKKTHIPGKYILLLLTAICIAMIIASYFFDTTRGPVRTIVGYVTTPIQKCLTIAGDWVEDRFSYFRDKQDLISENERLQEQVETLTLQLQEQKNDFANSDRLQQLYEFDAMYKQYPKIAASVIGKDTGNWFQVFLIDKGTNDGVSIGNNVLATGGLVGRVIDVGADWAKVRSIIDDASNVSAMVQETGDYCVLSGNLELVEGGKAEFTKMYDSDNNVVTGQALITSNISDVYLPDLFIGYLSDITVDSNNMTKSGTVNVAVDFEHLREVLVITQNK